MPNLRCKAKNWDPVLQRRTEPSSTVQKSKPYCLVTGFTCLCRISWQRSRSWTGSNPIVKNGREALCSLDDRCPTFCGYLSVLRRRRLAVSCANQSSWFRSRQPNVFEQTQGVDIVHRNSQAWLQSMSCWMTCSSQQFGCEQLVWTSVSSFCPGSAAVVNLSSDTLHWHRSGNQPVVTSVTCTEIMHEVSNGQYDAPCIIVPLVCSFVSRYFIPAFSRPAFSAPPLFHYPMLVIYLWVLCNLHYASNNTLSEKFCRRGSGQMQNKIECAATVLAEVRGIHSRHNNVQWLHFFAKKQPHHCAIKHIYC